MPKWRVIYEEMATYEVVVEASTAEDAEDKVMQQDSLCGTPTLRAIVERILGADISEQFETKEVRE